MASLRSAHEPVRGSAGHRRGATARGLTVRSGSSVPRPRTATCFHQRLQRPRVVVVEAVHRLVAPRFLGADFHGFPSFAASIRGVQPTAGKTGTEGYTNVF